MGRTSEILIMEAVGAVPFCSCLVEPLADGARRNCQGMQPIEAVRGANPAILPALQLKRAGPFPPILDGARKAEAGYNALLAAGTEVKFMLQQDRLDPRFAFLRHRLFRGVAN